MSIFRRNILSVLSYVPEGHDLPEGYTELKWAQCNATTSTYINIPTISSLNLYGIDAKMSAGKKAISMFASTNWGYVLGYYGTPSTLKSNGFGNIVATPPYEHDELYGDMKEMSLRFTNINGGPMRAFGAANDGYANDDKWGYMKLIGSADAILAELYPCKRDTDNIVGWYDKVGNTFYEAAAGSFTAGPTI